MGYNLQRFPTLFNYADHQLCKKNFEAHDLTDLAYIQVQKYKHTQDSNKIIKKLYRRV